MSCPVTRHFPAAGAAPPALGAGGWRGRFFLNRRSVGLNCSSSSEGRSPLPLPGWRSGCSRDRAYPPLRSRVERIEDSRQSLLVRSLLPRSAFFRRRHPAERSCPARRRAGLNPRRSESFALSALPRLLSRLSRAMRAGVWWFGGWCSQGGGNLASADLSGVCAGWQ